MSWFVYAFNFAIIGAMLSLVGFGKISWAEALVGIGMVLTPSAAHNLLVKQ